MKHVIPLARQRTWTIHGTQVMGILNATPDSFSDGDAIASPGALHARIDRLLSDGADCLDVGGESTRPGHTPVAAADELERVLPVIAAIRDADSRIPVSIDTSKASVAVAALEAGADFVNDVRALEDPAMASTVDAAGCAVVLMRHEPLDGDAAASCRTQFTALMQRAQAAGLRDAATLLDPGLGFASRPGADPEDNLALLECAAWSDRPVLIGHSRKRFVAALADANGTTVDAMTATLSKRAADLGAAMVRVHDVSATQAALHPSA